jgi:hypothetical protein
MPSKTAEFMTSKQGRNFRISQAKKNLSTSKFLFEKLIYTKKRARPLPSVAVRRPPSAVQTGPSGFLDIGG